jgi:DNA replication protein DnaC
MKSIEDLTDEIVRKLRDGTSRNSTDVSSSIDREISNQDASVGDPNCPLCHGVGYIRLDVPVGHPDFGRLFPCTCRLDELQSKRMASLRSVSNLESLGRYTFDSFSPEGHGLSPERRRNLSLAYQSAKAYARHPEGWLLLIGGYGCGKTHLAAAIANEALDRGVTPLFVTVPDLLDHLRATFAPSSPEGYSERFQRVRSSRLLILDDLGTENASPWALEKLFQILNYRYMSRLPTVITTNQELERIDPRLRSRLSDPELVEIVTILAPDYRLSGGERVAPGLNTLSLHSRMTLDTFDLRSDEVDRDAFENLSEALKLARTYAADPQGWVVFRGTYGVGKTHLAAGIANEQVRLGHPALLLVVPDLLDHLRAAFNPQGNVSYDKRFESVRRAPLLVLDDLGTESATPWAKEKLFQLVNYRYIARLPTVITTTLAMGELDPKIATRLLDTSLCTVFEIQAPPYMGGSGRRRTGRRR